MFTILFRKPKTHTLNSINTTLYLFILEFKSPINTFSSSSDSSESEESNSADKTRYKSEQVISLLKNYGFTDTHISRISHARPELLKSNPHKTLAPKINFLLSIGISTTHLPRFLVANPSLLMSSLKNQLIPCHNFLKTLLIDDQHVVKMLKSNSRVLLYDFETNITPNISLLTRIGVPKSRVLFTLFRYPYVVQQSHAKFTRIVEEVSRMGFNPMRIGFVDAVQVICNLTKRTWDRKWEVYKSWDLSDDEIQMAFRLRPICMSLSEEKINKAMEFYVDKMGWPAVYIMRRPRVIFYSLEKRIIPRCTLMKLLLSVGVLKKELGLETFLKLSEKKFLEKFVSSYEDKVPGLLNIYRGKNNCFETGIGIDDLNKID